MVDAACNEDLLTTIFEEGFKMTRFFDPKHRLILACFEASRAWKDQEKIHHKYISSGKKLTREQFDGILKTWQLARTLKLENRCTVRDRLATLANKYKNANRRIDTKDFLKDLDFLSADDGTNGKPCSLVSKYLFCTSPQEFSPYDQYTLRALNALGAKIKTADYPSFLTAFDEFNKIVETRLKLCGLTMEKFAFHEDPIECEVLFNRRVADKYLMLLGGYGDRRMVDNIGGGNAFPPETLNEFGYALQPHT